MNFLASKKLTAGDRTVPWLSQLKDSWELRPLKYCCSINQRTLDDSTAPDTQISYIDISSVDSKGTVLEATALSFGDAPSRARRILATGDTFVSTVRTYLTAIGYCAPEIDGFICSTGFAVLSSFECVDTRFLYYWMRSTHVVGEIVARSVGVSYPAINASEVGNLPVPTIPLPEQRAIAAFLDRKTAQIDAVVAKKQRLIERLQEKRQALISHAVTKGLDPHAPMKDSGIEWLGEIPVHWSVSPLKRFWNVTDCKHLTVPFVDDGIPVASIGEVQDLTVTLTAANKTLRADYLHLIDGGRKPAKGDIIYSRNATVGAAALVDTDDEFCMGQDVCLISSACENQEFLLFQLRSPIVLRQLDALMVGATFKRINVGQIKELLVCRPPEDEQAVIAQHCWKVHRSLMHATDRLATQITKLQEYRQTLISSAVTGKINVTREAAS